MGYGLMYGPKGKRIPFLVWLLVSLYCRYLPGGASGGVFYQSAHFTLKGTRLLGFTYTTPDFAPLGATPPSATGLAKFSQNGRD
jgi:hypothetical protein